MNISATSLTDAIPLNKQSLVDLYEHHSPGIYRYAYRLVGDRDLAEECVSETFNGKRFVCKFFVNDERSNDDDKCLNGNCQNKRKKGHAFCADCMREINGQTDVEIPKPKEAKRWWQRHGNHKKAEEA